MDLVTATLGSPLFPAELQSEQSNHQKPQQVFGVWGVSGGETSGEFSNEKQLNCGLLSFTAAPIWESTSDECIERCALDPMGLETPTPTATPVWESTFDECIE